MQKYILVISMLFLCVFSFPNEIQAQNDSPYELKTAKELSILLGATGGVTTSLLLIKNKQVLSAEQINALTLAKIPAFERFATNQWSSKARNLSDIFLYSAQAFPLLLLADSRMRKDWKKIGVITFETALVNAAITGLTKELIKRKRPFVFNGIVGLERKQTKDALSSFISGHTSSVAAMSFLTAQMYKDYHPNSNAKPYVWAMAASLPAITAFLRVKGGKHFPTDVISGYLVGALVGILVPRLHKRGQ